MHKPGIVTFFRLTPSSVQCDGYMSKAKPCPRCQIGRGICRERMTLVDAFRRPIGTKFGFVCTRCGWYFSKKRDGLTRVVHEDQHRIYLKTA
jgi:hypothetical protein